MELARAYAPINLVPETLYGRTEMATGPGLTGYANRRSLAGNAPKNYQSAQQKHANQRTSQSVRSHAQPMRHGGSSLSATIRSMVSRRLLFIYSFSGQAVLPPW